MSKEYYTWLLDVALQMAKYLEEAIDRNTEWLEKNVKPLDNSD